jgi:hypothetical protein
MAQVNAETARTYLKDPMWRAFWFHMHLVAKNLREFADGLALVSDDVFAYHVSGQKNDLARWVQEVVGDSELALTLARVKTKEEAATAAKARVAELEASLNN